MSSSNNRKTKVMPLQNPGKTPVPLQNSNKIIFVGISVIENGKSENNMDTEPQHFSSDKPDALFDLVCEKRPLASKWEQMDFYISDEAPITYVCLERNENRENFWKKKLRHVQTILQSHQKVITQGDRCGIDLRMRQVLAPSPATTDPSKSKYKTLGVPFENSIPVKVSVYNDDMSKPYLEFSNTFHFTDQKPDALYLYIMHKIPGVSVDMWRNFTYTVGNKKIRDKIHATGDLRTVSQWYAQLIAIQKTLKQMQDENEECKCGICLTIQQPEAHKTKTRAASQGKVTFSTAPTLTADLHQLLSDLHQIDYSRDRQRQR